MNDLTELLFFKEKPNNSTTIIQTTEEFKQYLIKYFQKKQSNQLYKIFHEEYNEQRYSRRRCITRSCNTRSQ